MARKPYRLDSKVEAALNERGIENVSVNNATVTKGDFSERLSGIITPAKLDQLALRIKAATGSTN
jgi:hypothetical protein